MTGSWEVSLVSQSPPSQLPNTALRMGLAGSVLLRTEETLHARGLGSTGTPLSRASHALGPPMALPVLNMFVDKIHGDRLRRKGLSPLAWPHGDDITLQSNTQFMRLKIGGFQRPLTRMHSLAPSSQQSQAPGTGKFQLQWHRPSSGTRQD